MHSVLVRWSCSGRTASFWSWIYSRVNWTKFRVAMENRFSKWPFLLHCRKMVHKSLFEDFDTAPIAVTICDTMKVNSHVRGKCIALAANAINPLARFTLVPSNYNTFTNGNLKDIFVSSERFRRRRAGTATAAVPKCAHNCISCQK